ncbi:MAG: ATP-binding protein, partial [Clostridia bacterium]|nr:ATP-binding protein [Clostridia bacterium]
FCLQRAGASELLTPREIIRDFLTVLTVLDEHPEVTFEKMMQSQKQEEPPTSPSGEENVPEGQKGVGLADLDF